uniref:DNA mismatch repair proteins mutS family domain-containing protein n=1 Tax=viral metagenome TaxID=1070528 RepID=A0A6C0JD78_9ZZZZ
MSKSSKSTKTDTEEKLHLDYLKYTAEYEAKYGNKTIVLLQCGSFFEVYSILMPNGEYTNNKIVEFCEVCQMNCGQKKNVVDKLGQVWMAGFQTYLLEKYLPKLLDSGYTVVVYIQEKEKRSDGKFNRVLDKVYSPGTYLSCETDSSSQITNNIMCIWMHLSKPLQNSNSINMSKTKDTIIYGVSVVNIFTGKSSIFESKNTFLMNNTTFDELERYVSVYNPSEVIIISPFGTNDLQKIIQYSGIRSMTIHKIDSRDVNNKIISNCENQRYIKQILTTFYSEETFEICSEFNENIMATQSFCYLLNFIQEHNPDLVRKISIPVFNNTSDRMVLANHTLMQLNIIDDGSGQNNGQFSSVLSLLNKCCSSIGKRKFQYQLTNPTFDEEWLNNEYQITSKMLMSENYVIVEAFRKILTKIKDIEKICRQIVVRKIYPSSIANLYKTIDHVRQMNTCLFEMPDICDYLCSDFPMDQTLSYDFVEKKCADIYDFLNKNLIIESCEKISSMTSFETNIIQRGVSDKLDKAIDEYDLSCTSFNLIKNYLNKLMQDFEKSPDTKYVDIHKTEKSGSSLQITSKRSGVLKQILSTIVSKTTGEGKIQLDKDINLSINLSEIKFKSSGTSSTTVEIESSQLFQLSKNMIRLKDIINTLISEAYLMIISKLENERLDDLEKLTKYIAKIDVLQCKAYLAKEYNYCCPIIDSDAESAYVSSYDLRHCLIEHIQQNEIYVTNDLQLGGEKRGTLLFGTNAVGKTSIIRATGVAIIMAQSGLFVPCSKFIYKPYTAIYSRILGNDNIFKGLSTFAVEMSELRIILKMADENSLILGDELCSGTESESALSIFAAGLMELSKKSACFIFATHFHEILKFDEISNLQNMSTKHMAVRYDRESDCLIYDRKLRDGSGPRIYGLEVCKSLYLEDEFLELAYSIRNKYYPENQGILSSNKSVYNARKVKGTMCERCGKNKGEEVHHLQQQQDANEDGFIGSFHKNHPANLEYLCEVCHDEIHKKKEASPNLRKKTTKGYKVVVQ